MNGVAAVEETSPAQRAALREELNIPEGTVVFGILARIEDYKGHLYLVYAPSSSRTGDIRTSVSWWPVPAPLKKRCAGR